MLGSVDFEIRSNYCLKKLCVVTERNEGKRNRQEMGILILLSRSMVIHIFVEINMSQIKICSYLLSVHLNCSYQRGIVLEDVCISFLKYGGKV